MITTEKKFSRADYLAGNCTHEQYYNQFVTDEIKSLVNSRFTKDELKKAYEQDEQFTSIKLSIWDNLGKYTSFPVSEIKERGDFITMAGSVCILKAAAKIIINE